MPILYNRPQEHLRKKVVTFETSCVCSMMCVFLRHRKKSVYLQAACYNEFFAPCNDDVGTVAMPLGRMRAALTSDRISRGE